MPLVEIREKSAAEIGQHQTRRQLRGHAVVPSTNAGLRSIRSRTTMYRRVSHASRTGDAAACSRRASRTAVSAGVSVNATTSDARIAHAYARPSGRNSAPCTPVSHDRSKHQHHDKCRVDDTRPDFHRRNDHDESHGPRQRKRPILAQTPRDVLDVDDGIIDDFAQRHRQPPQREGIDRIPHRAENHHRRQQRDRNRGERDRGCTRVEQKEQQDPGNQHTSDQERVRDVRERQVDEPGRAKDVGMQRDLIRAERRAEARRRRGLPRPPLPGYSRPVAH